jgi:tRNA 2-thiouridine synthesizing protein A
VSKRKVVDARGAYCPGPLMELIAALRLLDVGDEVEVWSADQGTTKDVPKWAAKVGHETTDLGKRMTTILWW